MSSGRVLVIDDEPVIQKAINDILRKQSFEVMTVSDGDEGIEMLRKHTYDLVITDIKMPKIDGMTLIKIIRSSISTELPVVVITGHGTIDTAIESLKNGAQGFILKPFTPKELLESVNEALTKMTLLKENIRLKAIMPLFDVNKKLLSEFRQERIFNIITEEALKHTGAERSYLMLNGKGGFLSASHCSGECQEELKDLKIRMGEGVIGMAAEKRQPLLAEAETDDPAIKEFISQMGIKSLIYTPITSRDQLIGILCLEKTSSDKPFAFADRDMAAVLCGQAGIAIANSRLYKEAETSYIGIIAALASTIEARDPHTAGHAMRMANYSVSIAKKLGISGTDLDVIYRAALLHDIGKIGIPDHILCKPEGLTPEEFDKMKAHPEIGGKILDNIDGLADVAEIVRHHHDRYDGNGYPKKLKGEEIPIGARIISVTDAFETMTFGRPYRKAIPIADAIDELKRMSGSQFDPMIVNTLISVVEDMRAAPKRF